MKLNRRFESIIWSKVKIPSRQSVLVRGGDGGGRQNSPSVATGFSFEIMKMVCN